MAFGKIGRGAFGFNLTRWISTRDPVLLRSCRKCRLQCFGDRHDFVFSRSVPWTMRMLSKSWLLVKWSWVSLHLIRGHVSSGILRKRVVSLIFYSEVNLSPIHTTVIHRTVTTSQNSDCFTEQWILHETLNTSRNNEFLTQPWIPHVMLNTSQNNETLTERWITHNSGSLTQSRIPLYNEFLTQPWFHYASTLEL